MEYKGVCNSKPKVILMKCTSRSRPDILLKTVSEYIRLANDTKNMVWLISLDQDDSTMANEKFCNQLIQMTKVNSFSIIFIGLSDNKIHAINRDVEDFNKNGQYLEYCLKEGKSDWQILLNISDDQRPIVKGWDDKLREAMPDDLDASIWAYDGGQRRINTMEVLGRAYYERFKYIYHPEYKSFFCDNEATEVARMLGKQIIIKECLIRHDHYAWNRDSEIKRDALYDRNDQYWKHDEDVFKRRKEINFGL